MHFGDFLGGYFKPSGNYELLGFWLAQWVAPGPACFRAQWPLPAVYRLQRNKAPLVGTTVARKGLVMARLDVGPGSRNPQAFDPMTSVSHGSTGIPTSVWFLNLAAL